MNKKNYAVFFSLRTLKSILNNFVDVFLVLYFLEVSNQNILPLGIYKLISVITLYLVIFFLRNAAKSKYRMILLRIGIILDFLYFLIIALLRDNVIHYIYLVGFFYGLEEGFYYSVYNILESDGIKNEERKNYIGIYTAIKSSLSIIFPFIFGSIISSIVFIKALVIILVMTASRTFLSFLYQDKTYLKEKKIQKKFIKVVKDNQAFKKMYLMQFFNGLTYEGAFSYIVT